MLKGVIQPCKLHCCTPIFVPFMGSVFPRTNSTSVFYYFTAAGVKCRVVAVKVSPYIITVQFLFSFSLGSLSAFWHLGKSSSAKAGAWGRVGTRLGWGLVSSPGNYVAAL